MGIIKNMDIKLSIIVPVYGVEKYILEFAQSLICQLNSNVELIVVNDGTKDKSINIFKNYVQKKIKEIDNIVWLEQENQGQSVARNYGISVAQGKYITFLDPDDMVENNYVYEILKAIELEPEIIHFNAKVYLQIDNNLEYMKDLKLVEDNNLFFSTEKDIIELYDKKIWFSWLRVVKKDFISINMFQPNIIFEDILAFSKIYRKIKKIKNIDQKLVKYRVHSKNSINDKDKALRSIDLILNEYHLNESDCNNLIYKQFIDLKINYKVRRDGIFLTLYFLVFGIFLNSKSLYFFNFEFLKNKVFDIFVLVFNYLMKK